MKENINSQIDNDCCKMIEQNPRGIPVERFDIVVESIAPEHKIPALIVIRKLTNMGLADANAFVENLPSTLLVNISMEKAEKQKKNLEEAGAVVYLKPSEPLNVENDSESAQSFVGEKKSETSNTAGCSLTLLLSSCCFIAVWSFCGFVSAIITSVIILILLAIILDKFVPQNSSKDNPVIKHPVFCAFILGFAAFYITKAKLGTWQAWVSATGLMVIWGLTYSDIFVGSNTNKEEKSVAEDCPTVENTANGDAGENTDAIEQCDTDSSTEYGTKADYEITCFAAEEAQEHLPEDLFPADLDDELPKITLTAQAKKGEEWLKKNLCNGQYPEKFLLNRYLNNIPIMTQDEMEKFALSINIHEVKAYLECYEEWVASFVEYKLNENSANISNQDGQE